MVDLVQFVAEKTVAHYIGRLTPLIESHSCSALAIARELADAEASLSKKDYRVVLGPFSPKLLDRLQAREGRQV